MPIYCCVQTCKSNNRNKQTNKIKFFKFPKIRKTFPKMEALSTERHNRWIKALNIKPQNINHARVCERHFISGQRAHIKDDLNPDWVPSLHLDTRQDPLLAKTRYERKKTMEENIITKTPLPSPEKLKMYFETEVESEDEIEDELVDETAVEIDDGTKGKSAKISASTDPDWVPSLHMGENIDPLSDTRRLKKPLSKRRAETQQIRECQRKAVNAEFIKIDDDIDMDTDDKSEEEFLQDYLDEIRASQDDKETDGNNVSQDDDKSPEQRKKKKLHKVVVNCCVPMCKNARSKYKSKIMFFRFPKAEENNVNGKIYRNERQTAWINAIKRIDITHLNASNKIICSDHFITGAPAKDKSHPDWIPSQKLPLTLAKAVKQIETPDPLDEQEMQMHTISTVEEELKLNMDIIALQKEIEELKKENADLKKQVETKDIIIADHVEEIRRLVETQVLKLNNKDKIIEQVQANHRRITLSRDGFKNDDKKVTYMTGLPSLAVLDIIYDYVKDDLVSSMMKGVNKFDALVMVLLKLRLDLPMCYLGYRFGIAGNTCARVFHKNLKVLCDKIGPFIRWPEKTQPECTAVYFKKVLGKRFTALIDFIEDPGPDVSAGHLVQNNYKRNKYLVAISPAGAIVFVSKGYDVNMSLKEIAESCGVLDYTDDGDIILSDYGKAAHQVLSYNGSKVIVPTNQENDLLDSLLQNPSHTNTDGQVEPDNSRIYIHRSLSVLKNRYFVLTNKYNHGVATKSYKISEGEHYFDYVVKVCCALTNVSPAIITLENKKS